MLFVALARRYGLKRYRRQVHHGDATRVADETLWPEFLKLDRELMSQLDTLTQQVIAQAIHADTSDAVEREGQLALTDRGA